MTPETRASPGVRTRVARWALAFGAAGALYLAAAPLEAHESAPGVVALKEIAPGRFLMRWSPPSPPIDDLKIHFPASCRGVGDAGFDANAEGAAVPLVLECGASGLVGEITFASGAPSLGRIAVNVEWLEGSESMLLSSGSPAHVSVQGSARPGGPLDVLRQYLALGVEHIWFGIDHLLFLLGLLLLVRGWRSTLMTVSAFTVAHSLTLALAALELVAVPTAPVEICIALSVLLLALETTRGADTATRRWPWLVAFSFGLLHGLGFASALSEVGLPTHAMALALLGFNLGVELGQVAVVGLVALGHRLLKSHPHVQGKVLHSAPWVLGTCSVYWLLDRVSSWLVGLGML